MFDSKIITFISVAKTKNLHISSQQLFLSPPAIKKQIDQLEKELNFALFIRSRKGMLLTEAGNDFYNLIDSTINSFNTSLVNIKRRYSLEKINLFVLNALYENFNIKNTFLNILNEGTYNFNTIFIPFIGKQVPSDFFSELQKYNCGIYVECYKEKIPSNYIFSKITRCPLALLVNKANPLYSYRSINLLDITSQEDIIVNIAYTETIPAFNNLSTYFQLGKTKCYPKADIFDFMKNLPENDSNNVF